MLQSGGRLSFSLIPADHDRLLLVNGWYLPEWRATDPRIKVLPLFGQLLGVLVAAGVGDADLVYRPTGVLLSYAVRAPLWR